MGVRSGRGGAWKDNCLRGAGVLSGYGNDVEMNRAVNVVNTIELFSLKIVDFMSIFLLLKEKVFAAVTRKPFTHSVILLLLG